MIPALIKRHPMATARMLRYAFACKLAWQFAWLPLTLVAAIALYKLAPALLAVRPLGLAELTGVVSRLEQTALVTVIGFFLAYALTIRAWKRQKRVELQLLAAGEFSRLLDEAVEAARDLSHFVEMLEELHDNLDAGHPLTVDPDYLMKQLHAMHALRQSLSQKYVAALGVRSRHEIVLSSHWTPSRACDAAESALEQVAKFVWFPIPPTEYSRKAFLHYIGTVSPSRWEKFRQAVDAHIGTISGASGAIRGHAHGQLFGPSLHWYSRLSKATREMAGS